jgi:hypothetical protein
MVRVRGSSHADASASGVVALKPVAPTGAGRRPAGVREMSETPAIRAFATSPAIPVAPVVGLRRLRTLLAR